MKVRIKVNESVEAEGLGVNDASFDMLRMVRVEVKVRLTIGGFSVKGGDKSPVFINRNLKIKIVNCGAAVVMVNSMVGWRDVSNRPSFWMDEVEPMKMKKRSSMKRFSQCMLGKPEIMQSRW